MKHFILTCLINTLCIITSVAQKNIPLVENMNLTECKLSDYASSVNYVPLETTDECLLAEELQVITTTQYIFVHDQIMYKVYRFDKTSGKYLNMVGSRGQGPGEYTRLLGFYVDDTDKKCFLLCNTGIYMYDYEGTFLKKEVLPHYYCPTGMERIGDSYVLNNMLYIDTKKELCLIDMQSKIKKEKELSYKPQIGFMLPATFFFKMDGQCYYKNDLSENIYILNDRLDMQPAYLIDCGKKVTNPKDRQIDDIGNPLTKDNIIVVRITGYNNILYIPYFVNGKRLLAIYNIKTGSVITAGKAGKSGMTDDLSDGPMILPPAKTSLYHSCVPNQLVSWFFPADIEESQFQKGEFGKLIKQLDEDSNPIIRIINLK